MFALDFHALDIDLLPVGRLPVIDTRSDDLRIVPQLFDHDRLAAAIFQTAELRDGNFEQGRPVGQFLQVFFHGADTVMDVIERLVRIDTVES